MPVFVESFRNGRSVYEVIDADGTIIESYSVEEGPERAIEACASERGCGPIFVPIPAKVPKGYSVVLVSDGPRTYFLVAAPGTGFLKGAFRNVAEAVAAARLHAGEEPEPVDGSTPPPKP